VISPFIHAKIKLFWLVFKNKLQENKKTNQLRKATILQKFTFVIHYDIFMKRLILGISFCFLFLGVNAQNYEFSIKGGGSFIVTFNSASNVISLAGVNNNPNEFQVLVLDKYKILSKVIYKLKFRT